MWDKLICPICDAKLQNIPIKLNSNKTINDIALFCCRQREIFTEQNNFKDQSHFEMEWHDNKPYYEGILLLPFNIVSYEKVSNIYHWKLDNMGIYRKHFIAEIPYLNLKWKDTEKVIQKLKLYTAFS